METNFSSLYQQSLLILTLLLPISPSILTLTLEPDPNTTHSQPGENSQVKTTASDLEVLTLMQLKSYHLGWLGMYGL